MRARTEFLLPLAEDPLVADAQRDFREVEVLEEGDDVLPGKPGQLLELRDRDLAASLEVAHELLLERPDDRRVEVKLLDPDDRPPPDERVEGLVEVGPLADVERLGELPPGGPGEPGRPH